MSNEEITLRRLKKLLNDLDDRPDPEPVDFPPKESKPTMEFSKLIFIVVSGITILLSFYTMYMIAVTKDLSPLAYLIPAVFGECAVATASYYGKAKAENVIKIGKAIEESKVDPSSIKLAKSIMSSDSDIFVSDEHVDG